MAHLPFLILRQLYMKTEKRKGRTRRPYNDISEYTKGKGKHKVSMSINPFVQKDMFNLKMMRN